MFNLHNILVVITIALYILGRLCDDLGWYTWDGITTDGLESIALGALTISAALTIVRRLLDGQEGFKIIFLQSQVKFLIPWSLVIVIVILLFNIFGCEKQLNPQSAAGNFFMDYNGCCLYTVVILLTNINYSVICNVKGELPLLIFYQIVLFGQIVYNGSLLIRFIGELTGNPKDYSILFISIFIAWQMLVMDLLFRGSYEDRQNMYRHQELHRLVSMHTIECKITKKSQLVPSGVRLPIEEEEVVSDSIKISNQESPKKESKVIEDRIMII